MSSDETPEEQSPPESTHETTASGSMTKAELLAHAQALEAEIEAMRTRAAQASMAAPSTPSDERRTVWINGAEVSWMPGDEASVPEGAIAIWAAHKAANPGLTVKTGDR